jgi:hypothetical protein
MTDGSTFDCHIGIECSIAARDTKLNGVTDSCRTGIPTARHKGLWIFHDWFRYRRPLALLLHVQHSMREMA